MLYVGAGQETQKSILFNSKGSAAYESFVDALGEPVELSTHAGFLGGLDTYGTTGTHAPYYATPTAEVIFHVVTRMPTRPEDPQQVHKKRHVGNDIVHVVWTDHWRPYDRETISSQFNDAHIIVHPRPDGLFAVHVLCKEKASSSSSSSSVPLYV